MHWQEACKKSKFKQAVRRTKRHSYTRNIEGSGIVNIRGTLQLRSARSEELEGYTDWEPINDTD